MPPSTANPVLDQHSVSRRFWRALALMPSLVAGPTSRNDIADPVFATILARHQMLGGALKLTGLARGDAVKVGKRFERAAPHRIVAIKAAPILAFKGRGSGFDEGS
jgi:hypothetical protein